MDLANLNAFIAIAETGSFSGAAERLFLTQPAISKRIASIEQQLKLRLFLISVFLCQRPLGLYGRC